MTYDTFSFFNELDLLEIRLNILDPHVDFFVLAESNETFSGQPKPLYYQENKERFAKWNHKIIHIVVDDFPNDPEISRMMDDRPYVPKHLEHFRRAFYQKESLRKGLADAEDDDIVYFGDLDEIWKPQEIDDKTYKLQQLCYVYYVNNRSSEDWYGTVVTRYKNIKEGSINDLRAKPANFLPDGGWHFTNMGGPEAIRAKIEAYDHQEYNKESIKAKIEKRMQNNEDYIGRNRDYKGVKFKFWIDESDLPQYLLENKEKYRHLFKEPETENEAFNAGKKKGLFSWLSGWLRL